MEEEIAKLRINLISKSQEIRDIISGNFDFNKFQIKLNDLCNICDLNNPEFKSILEVENIDNLVKKFNEYNSYFKFCSNVPDYFKTQFSQELKLFILILNTIE